jgi:hypothetical protein
VVGRSYGWGGCLRCDVWMCAAAHGRLATHGRVRMRRRDAGLQRSYARSRACAAPDGMGRGPLEVIRAAHAGVTGAPRPGRGGGAGPARGCGASRPATITPARAVAARAAGVVEACTSPLHGACRSEGRCPSGSPRGNPNGSPDPSAGDVAPRLRGTKGAADAGVAADAAAVSNLWGRPPRGRPCAVFGFHLVGSHLPAVW